MIVTVTGGAGYIGAWAARELLDGGHDVRVLDVLLHPDQEEVAAELEGLGVRVVRGDIRDPTPGGRPSRAPTRWSTWRRSWATPRAQRTPSCRPR